MDLVELIKDIDYQNQYSYERRVELFNKYQISVSEKFFVPIWGLSQYVLELTGYTYEKYYPSYGHGQRILDTNLIDKCSDRKNRIWYTNNQIFIKRYVANVISEPEMGTLRNVMKFNLTDKTISVFSFDMKFCYRIPRNLYDKIDEWLVDFGFDKW